MIDVLVIVHPDDETLGCGALLRHISLGHNVHWLIVTFWILYLVLHLSLIVVNPRLILSQALWIFLCHLFRLPYYYARHYSVIRFSIIYCGVVECIKPSILYLPFPGDAHSDYRCVYDAASSAAKCFRFPSVEKVLVCETPSETEFGISPIELPFRPNLLLMYLLLSTKK